MNKTSKLLKPYLRKFVLETHPDFFQYNSLRKQTNATSLQKLYNILQPDKDTKFDTETIKLKFFIKSQKKHNKELPAAVATFNYRDSEWNKANTFLNLCQQLNIPILQSDVDIVKEMISKELNKAIKSKPYKSLTQEFAEKLHQKYNAYTNKKWEPDDILKQKMIMFDPLVNQTLIAKKLCQWLPQLQPQLWWGKIPMLIISSNSDLPPKELTKDLLIFKSNMEFEDLKNYLDVRLKNITK
ncbi:uncharacterized protein BX663DRAFT_494223 [Cokeromyces recurvatus]|uniref:uncharacterized protein n=1 Tax=Cokeromyces recurvatus TaxID=90255 RepID=UPI002220399A|nr:uncharacterized protein BX663DRAFT_494223 [Cokeromyces recurvatus]KAI7906923.1 hypothetical protein BX663DRAFT_494223 [Cokeromyces recurvatus]